TACHRSGDGHDRSGTVPLRVGHRRTSGAHHRGHVRRAGRCDHRGGLRLSRGKHRSAHPHLTTGLSSVGGGTPHRVRRHVRSTHPTGPRRRRLSRPGGRTALRGHVLHSFRPSFDRAAFHPARQ